MQGSRADLAAVLLHEIVKAPGFAGRCHETSTRSEDRFSDVAAQAACTSDYQPYFRHKTSYKSACLLSCRLLSPLLVFREVGKERNISLRFESGKAIRQRLVDRAIGVAAERDPLRRRNLIDAVDDDFHHLGGIAGRKARRVFDHC